MACETRQKAQPGRIDYAQVPERTTLLMATCVNWRGSATIDVSYMRIIAR